MSPDLVFRTARERIVYVSDVKYKLADNARGRSGDYYQLLAYTTALDLPEGVLIYCRGKGEAPERAVTVKNTGKRLIVWSVDLSGSVGQVEQEVAALAERICAGM